MKTEIRNAIIESTTLGPEDHGIFSCYLELNYGSIHQSFGGYALDKHTGWRDQRSRCAGTAYGMEFIRRVMLTVGVERWEALKGKHVRVRSEDQRIRAISHIIEDRWFDPEGDLGEFIALDRANTEAHGK